MNRRVHAHELELDGGAPQTVAVLSGSYVVAMAIDEAGVYWQDSMTGDIWRAPLASNNASILFAAQRSTYRLVAREGWLYWGERDPAGDVKRAPHLGGSIEVLAALD